MAEAASPLIARRRPRGGGACLCRSQRSRPSTEPTTMSGRCSRTAAACFTQRVLTISRSVCRRHKFRCTGRTWPTRHTPKRSSVTATY